MKKRSDYTYQKFLIESDVVPMDLEKITVDRDDTVPSYEVEENIFDLNGYCRKVKLSTLDSLIDTEKDFENFVKQIQYVDCLYIEDDRSKSENPIYQAFSRSLQQKLVQKFMDRNICVKLMCV